MPEVSIVIPNFNRSRYLSACIESALDQTHSRSEVIVVDDGSTDDSGESLRRYDKKIRLIEQDHLGAAAARNTGIKAAGGDYIAFLSSDDLMEPQRVELQLSALGGNPEAGLVFCDLRFIDSEGKPLCEVYRYDEFARETFFASMLERNRIGSSSAVMVRQSILDKAGLFDEEIERKEEYDLWLRILNKSDAEYVPRALVAVRVGTGRTVYGRDSLSDGCYYLKSKNYKSALQQFNHCLEADPKAAELHNNIGVCLAIDGDELGAKAAFEQAATLRAGYFDPLFNLEALKGKSHEPAWRPTLDRLRPKLFPASPFPPAGPDH